MLNPEKVELLIFDLDGTIFSTTKPVFESVKRAFVKLDIPLHITEWDMEKYFGTASGEFYKAVTPPGSNIHWEDIRKAIHDEHETAFKEYAEAYPGVKETLRTLREREYKLVLHSNSSVHYFNTAISALGIGDYFDYAECVQENALTKTELVGKIINKFGSPDSAVIGDRIHDIEAARDNNALSIGVTYGYGGKEPEQADVTISRFPELLDIFDRKLPVFEKIYEHLTGKKQKDKSFVIGITGIDCSGKTSFAGVLERFLASRGLDTQLLRLDDFHNPMEYRYSGEDQAYNYFNKSFNIEKIVDKLLIPIRQKKAFTTRLILLNLETDKYEIKKKYTINQDTIVIFEGVFLFRKDFSPYLDLKIFLDIPFEECIRRAWKRDSEDFSQRYGGTEEVNKRYEGKYIPAQKKYLDEYPPSETADLIIDNSNWEYPKIIKML